MKKLITIMLCLGLVGCATVAPEPPFTILPYTDVKYAPTDPYKVKVFTFMPPDVMANYISIAEVTAKPRTFRNLKKMLIFQEAVASMGGTTVVFTVHHDYMGSVGSSYMAGNMIFNNQHAIYRSMAEGVILRSKDLDSK